MRQYLLALFAVLFSLTVANAIEPSDLKPGLVASYHQVYQDPQSETVRLEPTVALMFKERETPHPKMVAFGSVDWKGYVNITRPGKYTFSATVMNGTLNVRVGGKAVLNAESKDANAATILGSPVQLDGGVLSFEARFMARGTPCRVELFWEGPGFVKEPLPHQFLGHLPKDRPDSFAGDLRREHGRFLFEELSCMNCHKPTANDKMAKTLVDRTGPNLAEIGKRAYPGWINSWLADPAKLRPHTTMPRLFTDDARGAAERYAITTYLVSLSGKPLASYRVPINLSNDVRQSIGRGRVLYTVTGCAACHDIPRPKPKGEEDDREPLKPEDHILGLGTAAGPSAKYSLGALGSKTRPEALAAFLQNPMKIAPAGRMPHMNLNPQEATDIARFLCMKTDEVTETAMAPAPKMKPATLLATRPQVNLDKADDGFEKLPEQKQWVAVGSRLFQAKGCVNCHSVESSGKPGKPQGFDSLDKIKEAGATGCIGPKPNAAKVPVYTLTATETAALAAFLKSGLSGAGTSAPAYSARVALRRFNCLNCHSREGEGGIATELADSMRLLEKAANADDVRPPLLTGIGHKSRTTWLKSVLTGGGRARPWMQLRMPQYGEANVGFLPEALAAIEGTMPDDSVYKLPLSNQQISLGRQIVGKGGLGCISCHDIAGVANTGTRGPDLSTINQRVRYDWYERWMHQPLRMAPGTRMPQAFVEGKSTLSTVLDGDPKAQAQAMWSYLSLGQGLPLPDGLEPPKGLIIAVKERPEVLRTFMPDAGSKAIAVGYPGGVNIAFSADQCRLAYSWAGNFLDASPVWNNRGGAPAKLLGPKFWTAPPGHPWGLTTNADIPPDYLGRANNPAFGMPLPLEPARVYDGPRAVSFDGYSLDATGRPTFRYMLNESGKGAVLKVAETVVPLKATAATGLSRRFAVEAPAGYRAWLLAGQATKEPRVFSVQRGKQLPLDLKGDDPGITAVGTRIVLPQDDDRAVVLEVPAVPEGSVWRFVPQPGGGWLVVLRLPQAKEAWKGTLELVMWALPKDDDTLVKELAAK